MRKAAVTVIWLVVSVVGWIVWELVKDAVAGWGNTQLVERWDLIDPALQQYLLFMWGPPVAFVIVIGVALWAVYRIGMKTVGVSNAPDSPAPPSVGSYRPESIASTPNLVILHDKLRDTEWWPSEDGFNVKFRVLNDSDVRAKGVSVCIRSLEFLEGGRFRPYGHDYAEVPLATRDGKAEFDLRGGEEESVYIAKRSIISGESIQLFYARDGIPNTIPLKPAWRVGIRIIANNSPHKDATFELRVSADGSLVGTLLDDKETVKPIILAELETTVPSIGDFTPACAIRIKNTGPELEGKCLVQIEKHGLDIHMPDPLVIRTEGQIRAKRTGRFTLSIGQTKLVPILFRDPAQIDHFRFIGEDGKHYPFSGDSAEFVVAIYGAAIPTRVRIRLSVGQDWKINSEMEYC